MMNAAAMRVTTEEEELGYDEDTYHEGLSDISEELWRDYECFSDEDELPHETPINNTKNGRTTAKSRRLSLFSHATGMTSESKAHSIKTLIAIDRVKENDQPMLGIFFFVLYCLL